MHKPQAFQVVFDATGNSRKTNAQLNRLSTHIYTSTPKEKKQQQQEQRQKCNDAINLFGLTKVTKATEKNYFCVGGVGLTIDARLKALVLLIGIIIFGSRLVSLMMSLVNDNNVQQVTSFMQEQLNNALDWSERHQLRSWLSALLCGFIVSLFHYAIVYFDSAVPGVSPPTPFSPRSKRDRERSTSLHLNYLCAFGTGAMVTLFMIVDF